MYTTTIYRLVLLALLLSSRSVLADALMVNQSVSASSIAQYYINEGGVRLELEIGVDSIPAFRNLMPDGLYERISDDGRPLEARLQAFFNRDLAIIVDDEPLPGIIREIGPAKRVLRDPVTGVPLPVQEDAPDIIRATIQYPFGDGGPPASMRFTAPPQAEIGFVVYHEGVAVNDYRYLGSGYTLQLDWQDPWYSRFDQTQLRRQYSSPMSGFLYVEYFEVRKEIIVRPKDLQRWLDLGLEGREDIPPEMQPDILRKVGQFLSEHQPVHIDGEAVAGTLQRVNFLERTLTSSRVIDPPETLDIDAAVIGAIFIYPRNGLPEKVTMAWDLWDERVERIPVSAVDEAGPLPSFLYPDWPELEWENFLKNPTIPTLRQVQTPASAGQLWLARLLPALVILALASVLWLWRNRSKHRPATVPAGLTALFLAASIGAAHFGESNTPDQQRAQAIVDDLLHNIYRAFDYREEGNIYDKLSQSVSGELLTDIFLETKRSLVLANQGGAEARVTDIRLDAAEVQPGSSQGEFKVQADWTVNGSVGHWGHIHQRSNRYQAELTIGVDGGQWKLKSMNVLQEERL